MEKLNNVTVFDHPLIQHKLAILRDKNTGSKDFRELVKELAMLMTFEATRSLPLETVNIETPMAPCEAKMLAGPKITIVPILRAGLGMVEGIVNLIPTVRVGHIGLFRDPNTHEPVQYYCKLPEEVNGGLVIVLDPMLATGGSAVAAIDILKRRGAKEIKMMNIIASPEGVKTVHEAHPDVEIYVSAVDPGMNEKAYIIPGLGDAGDRIFGTK